MASMRRIRVIGVLAALFVVTFLWYSSSARASSQDFYSNTKSALDRQHKEYNTHPLADDAALAAAMAERKKDAETIARDTANAKAPRPDPVKGEKQRPLVENLGADRNVAGRKKYPIESGQPEKAHTETESSEDHDTNVELNDILKKSPIIIFSKSYCPHSKRAKDILLGKYDIVPKPFVVELDEHPIGALLQEKLGKMTGRRTVPNVLVNGKSIGGGDDIADLDETQKLAGKLWNMGGKQMQKVEQRPGQ